MDAHELYCDDLSVVYVSQTTTLYASNWPSAVCQLYLNITRKDKNNKENEKQIKRKEICNMLQHG